MAGIVRSEVAYDRALPRQKTTSVADVPFTVEGAIVAPSINVEIRNFPTDRQLLIPHCDGEPLLNMLLSPWPNDSRGVYRANVRGGGGDEVGSVMLLLPDQPALFQPARGSVRTIQCRLSRKLFDYADDAGRRLRDLEPRDCLNINSPRISQGLARLTEEVLAPGFASAAFAEVLARLLALETYRYFWTPKSRPPQRQQGLAPWQFHMINDHLRSMDGMPPSIRELADLCRMSSRNLLRRFKASTGKTLLQHIAELRAARARELLAGTDWPIKKVAFELGFSGPSAFCVAFLRATGVTPGAYRRDCGR